MEKRTPNPGNLPNEPASDLTKYSALIFTIVAAAVFLARMFFFEGWLIRTKLYRPVWARLSWVHKRSFMVHNIGAVLKIILMTLGVYPWAVVTFGTAKLQDPVSGLGGRPTLGDLMIVTMQIFQVGYIFELFYRPRISYVTGAHHLGTVLLGQVATALTLNTAAVPDATLEFVLCFSWGAFDVLGQFWPHVVMITYRFIPNNHRLLARIFYIAMWVEAISPFAETALIFWLYGGLWDRWSISMKIATPVLHVIFKASQFWGARVFYQLARKEEERLRQKHLEGAVISLDSASKEDSDGSGKTSPDVQLLPPSNPSSVLPKGFV
ncbi:hypothetical protein QBC46DRAFT_359546 [Diplogelasinospora grovesii]|uniref:TLC domain-containing protein n=1 Tax=Diplogelasinospora grovesii TaxID=303347 RepID=A0AAN6RXL6_9PEZI|nr:hypothetical protein QBC46DRAFT_359546 [Diplogelasinospora grovesii]